ncbi:YwqG family protein [Domibacillus mangrovi]|uniref:DUF1963 domain-containing protein n=1 Tax=Domibacillus mangrovi TaxID=1714354 RepID=A0A1Q5P722_9BACI|nr:YwqG family protein [Domibacillus mangrovi]OKL37892.1 hypothetical protein BLL40_00210 [Domibacillus mangrovi]
MSERLQQLITEFTLDHVRADILSAVYECVSISSAPAERLPGGASKFGGVADLPAETAYPSFNGTPLSFIGQINLTEVSALRLKHNPLPMSGMLSFFYYNSDEVSVYGEPEHRDGWRVLYTDDTSGMSAQGAASYPERRMLFKKAEKLEFLYFEQDEDDQKFEKLMDQLDNRLDHQLLGIPMSIQGEVFEETAEHIDGKPVLLFQVDTDNKLDMMWGDMGMLYYVIGARALASKRFEKTWFSMQCY